MNNIDTKVDSDNMLDEYDFSGGVRGKYAAQYREGTNIIRLDDDVAAVFRNAKEVNDFLRPMCKLIQRQADVGATRGS